MSDHEQTVSGDVEALAAASRVRAFLIERAFLRGVDQEQITTANWAPLLTSDLRALVDLAARDDA